MLFGPQPSGSTPAARSAPPLPTRVAAAREAIDRRIAAALSVAITGGILMALAVPAPALAWDANSFNSASESQLYSLTNQSRAAGGMPSLRIDSTLARIARSRSQDMEERGYFSHSIPPSGKMVWDLMDERGYCYNLAGENIGWNNYPDDEATAQIQRMFMDSPGHHENIMGRAWDVVGIGAYKGSDGHMMWTVLFADKAGCGSPAAATPKPTPRPTPKPTPKPTPEAHAQADPAADPPTPQPAPTATPTPDGHADSNAATHAAAHPDSDSDAARPRPRRLPRRHPRRGRRRNRRRRPPRLSRRHGRLLDRRPIRPRARRHDRRPIGPRSPHPR